MRPVLRPGSVVLRRDRTLLQAGTSPGHGLLLRDAPGAAGLLRLLDGVRDLPTLREHPDAPRETERLVAELLQAGVVVDADRWHGEPAGLREEAAHLAARGVGASEARRRGAARRASRIEIDAPASLAALADAVTALLADSGLAPERSRIDAPDVVVLLADRPGSRVPADVLLHDALPHLPVVLEHAAARIGPFVVPGRTPCLACDDAARQALDPVWGALAAQLDRPVAAPPRHGPDGLSAATRQAVAAVVTAEVVAHVDGDGPATAGAVVTLGPGPLDAVHALVPFARRCRCAALRRPHRPVTTMEA